MLNVLRGFVSQKLQTQGHSWRNDSRAFMKKWLPPLLPCEGKLLSEFPLAAFSSLLWQNKVCTLTLKFVSIPVFVDGKKDCWKYENINSFQEDGERGRGIWMQLPKGPGSKSSHAGNWALVTSEGPEWPYTGLPLRFLTSPVCIPQELVLRIHYKEWLWTCTITLMTESLRTARGKLSPQTKGAGESVKEEASGSTSEPNYRSLSSGFAVNSFPTPQHCSSVMSISSKKGDITLKNSQFQWEWFCWHRVEQYSMAVKYNKGITVLFWFIFVYKGRKKTNFKGFASGPDFRP